MVLELADHARTEDDALGFTPRPKGTLVYLHRLQIKNLKLIRDIELSFERDNGEPRMWTVLLGENGLCKTSILQAIAMVASGKTRANQLADVVSLRDRRNPNGKMVLDAGFGFAPLDQHEREYPFWDDAAPPQRLHSRLWLEKGAATLFGESDYQDSNGHAPPPHTRAVEERVGVNVEGLSEEALDALVKVIRQSINPLDWARAQNLPHWLTVGYGVGRALPEPKTSPPPKDAARDRLRPLFGTSPVVGTDFIDWLAAEDSKLALNYTRVLAGALFNEKSLLPMIDRLERRGRGGVKSSDALTQSHRFSFRAGQKRVKLPATWLSQGYQGTIAWVADLIGQAFWDAKTSVEPSEMSGLVLIDELDLHLHPSWQVNLVSTLKRVFPKMQFVVTTHSPMLLPGLAADEIVMLGRDEKGSVVQVESDVFPNLMTGTELYKVFFGLHDRYPTELGKALSRYSFLAGDPGRSNAEDEEMRELRRRLREGGVDPGWEPMPIEPEMQDLEPS